MTETEKVISHIDKSKDDNFISLHNIPENHNIDKYFLNIENKTRSNLLTWKGQFSPQLVEILINKYAKKDFTLFDPFLGSGTLLVESARNDLSAFGSEINPAAYNLSNLYHFCSYNKDKRDIIIKDFENYISINEFNIGSLFDNENNSILESLLDKLKITNNWDFKILIQGLIILIDIFKNGSENDVILKYWLKLKKLVLELPFSTKEIKALNEDARHVSIDDDIIDLVITSPPYINVFNYHQQYRASAEKLGENVLTAAKSEIGSNRKHRGNRYLTVIQYILDMHSIFLELQRICKNNSRIIFIVGRESNVRKTCFFNSEIIASIANIAGMEILFRQERVFKNRFGQNIFEDIIHFKNKKNKKNEIDNKLHNLALKVLTDAIERAPEESKQDLKEAIISISKVKESPIYKKESS